MLRRLRRAIGRRLGRSLPEPDRTVVRGWYTGRGIVQPFDTHPPILLGTRISRRLHFGDEVRFEAVDGEARRVEVTRRAGER